MPPAPHEQALLRVGGLSDIPDGGDGHKPRQAKRRPCAAPRTQLGELIPPARRAHETVQGVGHHPNDGARTADAAQISAHVTPRLCRRAATLTDA